MFIKFDYILFVRSVTVTASANFGDNNIDSFSAPVSAPAAQARIDDGVDTSAVVRAVVSVAGGEGNLLRRGSVTDITNE